MSLFNLDITGLDDDGKIKILMTYKTIIGPSVDACLEEVNAYKDLIDIYLSGKDRSDTIKHRLKKVWHITPLNDKETYPNWECNYSRVNIDTNQGCIPIRLFNMEDAANLVYDFNQERGFLETPYDVKKEATYILEELMEMFTDVENPKEMARKVIAEKSCYQHPRESKEDILDAFADIIIFALGGMQKVLYQHQNNNMKNKNVVRRIQNKIFENITKANSKKSKEVDSFGKNIKGDQFEKPFIPLDLDHCVDEESIVEKQVVWTDTIKDLLDDSINKIWKNKN